MEGAAEEDHLVLQIKEARDSVLAPLAGKSSEDTPGQRVVKGQKAMQIASDVLLGWTELPGKDGAPRSYYVRQLWDGKGSAHAHARTGDRFAIAGYLGKGDGFDRALVRFAKSYADQNECDYRAFLESLR